MSKIEPELFETCFEDGRFHNGWGNHPFPSRKRVLRWLYTRTPEIKSETHDVTIHTTLPHLQPQEIRVTFISHATTLIQIDGFNILTDPLWSKRLGPLHLLGIRRVHPPAIALEALPPVHAVIISHNHYDHLDAPTLRRLRKNHDFQIICPQGLDTWFTKRKHERVTPLNWWQDTALSPTCSITAVPAQHWSQRTLRDRNQSHWFGASIRTPNAHVFFAGDTGYGPHFKEITRRLGAPNLSLIPIGSYLPDWLMKHHHLSPAEAMQAHIDLGSHLSLPIHFDTFPLGDEPYGQALLDLASATKALTPSYPFPPWHPGDMKSL